MRLVRQTINKGTVFLINIRKISQRRELSPVLFTKDLNLRNKEFQRRALSPRTKDTYIALNNLCVKNDRYHKTPL